MKRKSERKKEIQEIDRERDGKNSQVRGKRRRWTSRIVFLPCLYCERDAVRDDEIVSRVRAKTIQ